MTTTTIRTKNRTIKQACLAASFAGTLLLSAGSNESLAQFNRPFQPPTPPPSPPMHIPSPPMHIPSPPMHIPQPTFQPPRQPVFTPPPMHTQSPTFQQSQTNAFRDQMNLSRDQTQNNRVFRDQMRDQQTRQQSFNGTLRSMDTARVQQDRWNAMRQEQLRLSTDQQTMRTNQQAASQLPAQRPNVGAAQPVIPLPLVRPQGVAGQAGLTPADRVRLRAFQRELELQMRLALRGF